jgi:hypothetical protein
MLTDTIKWIEINLKVLDTINDNRSIIGSTEVLFNMSHTPHGTETYGHHWQQDC